MHALARAIAAAGTVDDIAAIRAAFPKAFPMLGDKFPTEYHGISDVGRFYAVMAVSTVKNEQYSKPAPYVWWAKRKKNLIRSKRRLNWAYLCFRSRLKSTTSISPRDYRQRPCEPWVKRRRILTRYCSIILI